MKVGIEQRVQLYCRLGRAKRCPWEHRQTQIDGGGIERIHGVGQFHAEVVSRVQGSRLDDQSLGEFEVDVPVAQLVGIGQRGACHRLGNAHVIKLASLSRQADLDIAQAFAVGKLGESHDAKLIGATEGSYPVIAAVTIHDAMEGLPRQEVHDLREQRLASVHRCERFGKACSLPKPRNRRSNRRHPLLPRNARQYWLSSRYPYS